MVRHPAECGLDGIIRNAERGESLRTAASRRGTSFQRCDVAEEFGITHRTIIGYRECLQTRRVNGACERFGHVGNMYKGNEPLAVARHRQGPASCSFPPRSIQAGAGSVKQATTENQPIEATVPDHLLHVPRRLRNRCEVGLPRLVGPHVSAPTLQHLTASLYTRSAPSTF